MENQYPYNSVSENPIKNGMGFIRMLIIILGIHMISLILGFAIYFIVFGAQIALSRIIIYWEPTRNWLAKNIGLGLYKPSPTEVSSFYNCSVNIFHAAIAIFFAVFGFYVIRLGVNILLRDGFLGQNFIYLLFFRK